jgi:S1-C subfamily serine protease
VQRVFKDLLVGSASFATWLGVTVDERDGGLVVNAVEPGGPAAEAGLREGDRLTRVGDEPVASALDYARALAAVRPGQEVAFDLLRGRSERVALRVRAMSNTERDLLARTGLELELVDSKQDAETVRKATLLFYAGARRGRVPSLGSVLRVREVQPDSPAADLGFRGGDVIVATRVPDFFGARTAALRSVEEFADAARQFSGGRMFLVVMRDGEALEGELDVKRL